MDTRFGYTFPAIRGIQAKREYYVSMCPLRLIPRIFLYNEIELKPELRAQRTLNKNRIPDITRYILKNSNDYVFSAITASIDGDVVFTPLNPEVDGGKVGVLHVPMDSKFLINDGQHRRAAIESALEENPELGEETIAVVFFLDIGLERCQQMFADLNRYAIRPSRSLGVLYDYRDDLANLCRLMILRSNLFRDIVEMEKSSLSKRSRKLFTLSAIYKATSALLANIDIVDINEGSIIANEYWEEVAKQMNEWQLVRDGKVTSGEIRTDFIHSHGVILESLGVIGNLLMNKYPQKWKSQLRPLKKIDWSRSNYQLWEGRAMNGGRVSNTNQNVILTTNILKKTLNLPLTDEENRFESAFLSKNNGK